MDTKKFMQLVEDKKRRALEKKEATLKWAQKLDAAANGKTVVDAKARKLKSSKHKRRYDSDSDSGSDDRRKLSRTHKKHKKRLPSDSSDSEKKEKRSKRKPKRSTLGSSDESSDESGYEGGRKRKKRSHRRHRVHGSTSESDASDSSSDEHEETFKRSHVRHHMRHRRADSDHSNSSDDEQQRRVRRSHAKHPKHKPHRQLKPASDSSSCEDGEIRKNKPAKYHTHHRRSVSVDLRSSESDSFNRVKRSRSLGKSSDDNHDQAGKHHRDGHDHYHPLEEKDQNPEVSVKPNIKHVEYLGRVEAFNINDPSDDQNLQMIF